MIISLLRKLSWLQKFSICSYNTPIYTKSGIWLDTDKMLYYKHLPFSSTCKTAGKAIVHNFLAYFGYEKIYITTCHLAYYKLSEAG